MILEIDGIEKGTPGWDLGDINDVLITNVVNAQVLQYQSSSGKWINATVSGTGDVVGPSSSVSGNLALFDGITGKLIKDGGTITTAGKALLDDASAADQRTTLGLGGAAILNVGSSAGTVCAGDDSRLSDARTPTSHSHGNIANAGTIGSTANLPLITTTGGAITVGAFGTGATDFCAGNDSRLSDSRTPTAHALDGALHTVSGLTTGHFLKATGATTFGFAAHGLTYSDVGAVQAISSTANRLARFASTTGQISDSSMREDSSGNVTVTGNLTVQGQSFQADHKIITGDTFILVNNGETGAGVTNLRAGLDIDRGTLYPYRFQMHETTDDLRIGQYYVSLPYTGLTGTFQAFEKVTGGTSGAIGWIITDNGSTMTLRGTATAFTNGETITGATSAATATAGTQAITDNTQAVATREGVPTSAGVAYWNAGQSRMDTCTGVTATANGLTAHSFSLNTNPSVTPATGMMYWDATEGTPAVKMNASVTQTIGTEFYRKVTNKTGVQINDGAVVYISGAQGNRPTAALALANAYTTACVIGVATENIANDADGWVTISGDVHSFDTSSFTAGDLLYLSATTPGALTNTAPSSPNMVVLVATALNATNNGTISVHPNHPLAGGVALGTSNLMAPTQNAVKTYADGKTPKAGFVDRTNSTLGMSGADFQITTGSSYDFYIDGTKYTKSTTQSVTISNNLTQHFIYFDSNGDIQVSTSFPTAIFSGTAAFVATVYKDGSIYLVGEERHSAVRNLPLHSWAHNTIGARYYTGLTGTFGNSSLSITQGTIYDEDIANDTGGTKTTCNLLYRNTLLTAMRVELASSTPYKASAGVLQYDNAGTLTAVGNNNYACQYVYATNDTTNPIYVVVGQNSHANAANARAEALPSILITTREWKLIYRVIYRNIGGTATYIETADYREAATVPGGTPATINAASVTFAPGGNIVATNVQSAIDELDAEKATLIHNLVDTTNHPVAGLTSGHFLKATGATTYGFAAHGLALSDLAAGVVLASDGTAAAPSHSFANDTNTGIYSYGADQIGFATAGVVKMAIKTTGLFTDRFGTASDTNTIIGIDAAGAGNLSHGATTTGWQHTLVGNEAGRSLTTSYATVAIGVQALYSATSAGIGCVAIGYNAGYTTNSNYCVHIGFNAGRNSQAAQQVIIGNGAGYYSAGVGNVGIGDSAIKQTGAATITGLVGVGFESLKVIANGGNNNTALGYQSGVAVTSGANNLLLGYKAGDNLTTGSGNIIIGYDLDVSAVGVSNELNIGGTIKGNMTGTTTTAQVYFPDGAVGTPSISFQSDTNTGLYWVSADKVAITTGGTQRVIVDDTGKVGIGTSNPNFTITAQNGNGILLRADVNAGTLSSQILGFAVTASGGNAAWFSAFREGASEATALTFNTWDGATSAERMRLTSSGNLGVGTSAALAKVAINGGLHVGGDSDPGDNNCTVDGEMLAATIATNASYSWTLGGYTATAPTETGYITVTIEGTTYKLLAATV